MKRVIQVVILLGYFLFHSFVLAQTLTLQVGSPVTSGPATPCGNGQLTFNGVSPSGCAATFYMLGAS